ncbi:SDR family NAD(P)-dependent oxidoreductase [Haliea sp. E1-2-M8]|uniref:SDR family NAD(P)-dependent oxidoreductase n=1 Tax=Haliea sp. E1-2-M8 TaxID=3064706 RepID=UPI002723ABB2|nr:SDR family NAD(P)-dependent oxidoreductase [Haliea sp. E1-2-M8]MDO8861512.1 SDR family NAD(P)-dependent oxidoreductase [Haliea sp. E1-2-M8]
MGQLQGKTALITGASRGIGHAIATRFAAEGAAVVLCASRLGAHGNLPGTLEEAVAAINGNGGRAAAEVCDLLDPAARADLIARAAAHFGPIDILVNNAAGSSMDLPSRVTTAKRNMMVDLNLNVPMELAEQALAGMRERGTGWILSISSATVNQPLPPYRASREAALVIAAYGASKAALNRYSEGLAHELAPEHIYVNTLAPESIVLTPGAEYVRDIARRHPDWAEPIEMMAEAALSLCSGRYVGQMAYSRQWVLGQALSVHSLDGKTVLGDAFLPAEI